MGFTVKMCNDFAKKIINEIFWIKYKPTIKDNNTWYENLNNFLVKEWDILQESENTENELMDDEEDMIIRDAMDFLLDKLNVDEDEFEEHEQDVDWRRFDDIIGYYTCII
jgi:hypothetical protein|tara:strand:+ start:13619 stop:13948 length:330 start_codon:yes stop_codon:yes gene_type:complete